MGQRAGMSPEQGALLESMKVEPSPVTDVAFDAGRLFQVWSYRVGHSQLVLRSNRDAEYPTRVELLFKSVSAVHLPTAMSALAVRVLQTDAELPEWAGPQDGRNVYAIQFSGGRGYVVAGAAFVAEDALDFTAPSPFAGSLGE